MLVTIMLPYHVTLVPQYILYNELQWINTYFPLILPKWLAQDSFFILLMVQFIRGIPRDESATIDGCGQSQIFPNCGASPCSCIDHNGNLHLYLELG